MIREKKACLSNKKAAQEICSAVQIHKQRERYKL